MKKQEEQIQIQVSHYLRLQYPNVIFTFDAAGLRLPIGLAVKAKKMRSGRGLPDMLILEPSITPSGKVYHGLFLELKVNYNDVYLKNGELRKNKHIGEQANNLYELNRKDYYATFAFGFNGAKGVIDNYMSNVK